MVGRARRATRMAGSGRKTEPAPSQPAAGASRKQSNWTVGWPARIGHGDRMHGRLFPDRSREGVVGSEETIMPDRNSPSPQRDPWNKGRLIGQKRPLKPRAVWSIRVRLQLEHRARDLAMFNLAIDSKLRGCDLVQLQIDDVSASGRVRDRATVIQKKTGRPVQFEITEQTRAAIRDWLTPGVPQDPG
jgi:hypothetical protein